MYGSFALLGYETERDCNLATFSVHSRLGSHDGDLLLRPLLLADEAASLSFSGLLVFLRTTIATLAAGQPAARRRRAPVGGAERQVDDGDGGRRPRRGGGRRRRLPPVQRGVDVGVAAVADVLGPGVSFF